MRNAILMGTTQLKSIKNTRTHIRCTDCAPSVVQHLSFGLCFFSFICYKFVMVQFSIQYSVFSVFFRLALCYKLVALHIINNYGIINICVTYFCCCFKSATSNTNRYRGEANYGKVIRLDAQLSLRELQIGF